MDCSSRRCGALLTRAAQIKMHVSALITGHVYIRMRTSSCSACVSHASTSDGELGNSCLDARAPRRCCHGVLLQAPLDRNNSP